MHVAVLGPLPDALVQRFQEDPHVQVVKPFYDLTNFDSKRLQYFLTKAIEFYSDGYEKLTCRRSSAVRKVFLFPDIDILYSIVHDRQVLDKVFADFVKHPRNRIPCYFSCSNLPFWVRTSLFKACNQILDNTSQVGRDYPTLSINPELISPELSDGEEDDPTSRIRPSDKMQALVKRELARDMQADISCRFSPDEIILGMIHKFMTRKQDWSLLSLYASIRFRCRVWKFN